MFKPSYQIRHAKNKRADAAWVLNQILEHGRSSRELMPIVWERHEKPQDRAWLQEMIYGSLRNLPKLQAWLRQLLDKPLKKQQKVIEHLLMIGLYQLAFTRTAEHAAVSETVAACKTMKEARLSGLVNAVLRNFQRKDLQNQTHDAPHINYGVPKWIYRIFEKQYCTSINETDSLNHGDTTALNMEAHKALRNMHERAPVWLRVNQLKISIEDYCDKLELDKIEFSLAPNSASPVQALKLDKAGDITKLPGFEEGLFAVQDLAAQHAAHFLDLQAHDTVLDCCAAPGGKSAGILEHQANIGELTILDIDDQRMLKIHENFARLGHSHTFGDKIKFVTADASTMATNKIITKQITQQYDKILLDAPCSATGVIRRHPDIMWLRKPSDIQTLVELQANILEQAWQLLKPGGTLLYATCSIMPQENAEQIEGFIAQHNDATLNPIRNIEGKQVNMWQILPGQHDMDGFFYAKLLKRAV